MKPIRGDGNPERVVSGLVIILAPTFAFDAARASPIVQSSLTTARRVLRHLISPPVRLFVEYPREQGGDICELAVGRLRRIVDQRPLTLWQGNLRESEARAAAERLGSGERLLSASINNADTLEYLVTGTEPARGYIFQRLDNARQARHRDFGRRLSSASNDVEYRLPPWARNRSPR